MLVDFGTCIGHSNESQTTGHHNTKLEPEDTMMLGSCRLRNYPGPLSNV